MIWTHLLLFVASGWLEIKWNQNIAYGNASGINTFFQRKGKKKLNAAHWNSIYIWEWMMICEKKTVNWCQERRKISPKWVKGGKKLLGCSKPSFIENIFKDMSYTIVKEP